MTRLALLVPIALALPLPYCLQLKVEVEPKARITKHVLLVVDRSGSMQGDPLSEALGAVTRFLHEPVDELQVGILAFSDGTTRWPGIPEKRAARPVPEGWAAFPSKEALERAQGWLSDLPARGGTNVAPALREALSEARRELTIMLITDGKFPDAQSNVLPPLVAEAQAEREKLGHGRAVIACYGIGPTEPTLIKLAELGEGGYFRDVPEEEPVEEPEASVPSFDLPPTPIEGQR